MTSGAENQEAKGRGEFSRSYREYAAIYGKSPRTLKRLVKDGREKGDLPPMDSPVGMVAWWERNMQHRVPAEFFAAAGGDSLMEIPPVVRVVEKVVEVVPPPEDETVVPEGRGLEATLEAVEKLEATLRTSASDAGKTKSYLDTVNRLTILSGKLRDEAERMKKLLPRDVVETIIHEFHGPIEREIRLLYRTMCEALGLPPSPEKEETWNREIDRVFARLGETILAAA